MANATSPVSRTVLLIGITGACVDASLAAVRIVDYGADMGYGQLRYRMSAPELERVGDHGQRWASFWKFSLTEPLSPPGLRYNTLAPSARFYGGLVLIGENPADPKRPRMLSEGHLNSNHEFRDDWNFMGGLEAFGPHERVEAHGTWFWTKEDFLNGGASAQVSFDAESTLSVHVSRYFGGLDEARWLVRDGDTFYLSRSTFAGHSGSVLLDTERGVDAARNPVAHRTHTVSPVEEEWAEYAPAAPYAIAFDASSARFAKRRFVDVTAVGFYVTRHAAPPAKVAGGLRPPFALKWNAVRCDAVVERDASFSPHVPLVRSSSVGLLVGVREVSFAEWETVRCIQVSNQKCGAQEIEGYVFDRDGLPMEREGAYRGSEAVTGITRLDALAWCNALSELEGLEPAYVLAENGSPLRRVLNRDQREEWERRPRVEWRRSAGGYRLATVNEWHLLGGERGVSGMSDGAAEFLWSDDSGVSLAPGEGAAEEFGAHSKRIGFRVVRGAPIDKPLAATTRALWSASEDPEPERPVSEEITALRERVARELALVPIAGGARTGPADALPPAEKARRVRLAASARNDRFLGKISAEVAEEIIRANILPQERAMRDAEVGATEVSHGLWSDVAQWARSQGYRFDRVGDPGSLRVAPSRGDVHTSAEPVTGIGWYDAIAWCNALSELMGFKPVYYSDENRTVPYRKASRFRLDTFGERGAPNLPSEVEDRKNRPKGSVVHTGSADLVLMDPDADGFRLPLFAEYMAWNTETEPAAIEKREWTLSVSGGRTHPVGTREAYANGLRDLNGNVLEWGWDQDRAYFSAQNADFRLNGGGYFAEAYSRPRAANPEFFSEYTATAWTFVGLRVMRTVKGRVAVP